MKVAKSAVKREESVSSSKRSSGKAESSNGLLGAGVLDLITTGMYGDPCSMYREYLQNALDAANPIATEIARVDICIDLANRNVRIRDNGRGLSAHEVREQLLPVARSGKRHGVEVGFRGVGRLSGLVFAESVSFVTRRTGDQKATRLTWDSLSLREFTRNGSTPDQVIRDSVQVEEVAGDNYPEHFFDVEVNGVARHAASAALNREKVVSYISQVCPVPLGNAFPFVSEIDEMYEKEKRKCRSLEVYVDGHGPVRRPYDTGVAYTDDNVDLFCEWEALRIPSADDEGLAAIGWIAHSSYARAIPRELGIRGIRARQGNIQVGDEGSFDHLFADSRFNRWCVGEVHVLEPRIVPNARRDYFEASPHVRNLENHLAAVAQAVSKRCRQASVSRNRLRRQLAAVDRWEGAYELALSGYLGCPRSIELANDTLLEVRTLMEDRGGDGEFEEEMAERLVVLQRRLASFEPNGESELAGAMTRAELEVYQELCRWLSETLKSPREAKEAMEAVFAVRGQARGIGVGGSDVEERGQVAIRG